MNDNTGEQFRPNESARSNPKAGQYGGKGKATPNKVKPPLRYDTATNSFRRFSKPSGKKVGHGHKFDGSGKGHDGKYGAPDGGPGRDGRVGGTGPTPQSHFKGTGATYGQDNDGDVDDIGSHNDYGSGAKVGQGSGLSGKGHAGAGRERLGTPRTSGGGPAMPVFGRDTGGAGNEYKGKSMKLGGGGRFAKLKDQLSHKPGISNPGAVAASIGRKKYGAKGFSNLSHKGHL